MPSDSTPSDSTPSDPQPPFAPRYALCQELLADRDFAAQCETIARVGYDGIEIAPFTLVPPGVDPTTLDDAARGQIHRTIEDHGLDCVGLHWLLAKTEAFDTFHLTTDEPTVRARTAAYLQRLAGLCRDLGGGVLVFGSPQQRSLPPGVTPDQADEHALEVLGQLVPTLEATDTVLALEPLGPAETDYLNSCGHAAGLIERLGSEHVRLHQDVKAMLAEPDGDPLPELIARHAGITAHFHANDRNLQGPGMGKVDFEPILAALKASGYAGSISVEVFDYSPGPDVIAERSLAYLQQVAARV